MSWSALSGPGTTSSEVARLPRELRRSLSESKASINLYVTNNQTNITVNQADQHNYDGAQGTIGYLGQMAPPTPGRDDAFTDSRNGDRPSSEETEENLVAEGYNYIQDIDGFYKPGRYFGIWDPSDDKLHKNQFILLEAGHSEGRCLPVEQPSPNELSKSDVYSTHLAFFRSKKEEADLKHKLDMALMESSHAPPGMGHSKRSSSSTSKGSIRPIVRPPPEVETVYMHRNVHRDVPPGSYVCLKHTRTIAFTKYRCQDLGMLDPASLKKVRILFLLQKIESWGVVAEIKAELHKWE